MSTDASGAAPKAKFEEAELGDITEKNLQQVKQIHQVVFPITYNPKFYQSLPKNPQLSKIAYFSDIAVGVVCCTLHPRPNDQPGSRLYIMTLGVLSAYRNMGIGKKLLQYVLDYAAEKSNIHEVYLHVWVKNEDALNWYLKQGFKNVETIQNYYKNIEEPHCHLLVKPVEHSAVAPSAASGKSKN
eukprot:TRINITY_DN6059_c0_g1_i1.p1 TRINITY_DN6059_c0_g1~~TRINITY_DN6059_c0_g1_i1.p1  ORF type:complete len:199 (+),score=47.49 TRINITY_DN6059_c0_g1_i1:44-598(+)